MVPSYDGALVPLSIIHPKGMKLNGSNPTELTGYGAYGTTQNAVMDRSTIAQSEMGAVHAVCHVRGGGEYGEEWHLAGKGPTKPNTWRDFIACAEYLIANKYTSPARLAGRGQSAGGIMIGRAITERPELFRAAIINVGPSDALRAEITNVGSIAESEVRNRRWLQGTLCHEPLSPRQRPDGISRNSAHHWHQRCPSRSVGIGEDGSALTDRDIERRADPVAG